MNDHADLVRMLGGRTTVAAELGLPVTTLDHWPVRGIPPRHWRRIAQLARRQGLKIDMEWLADNWPSGQA